MVLVTRSTLCVLLTVKSLFSSANSGPTEAGDCYPSGSSQLVGGPAALWEFMVSESSQSYDEHKHLRTGDRT